jgi:hypothetical protein
MAFDPKVPEQQDQQYTHFFQNIQGPQPNVAGATRGQAIGQAAASAGGDVSGFLNVEEQSKQEIIGSQLAQKYSDLQENEVGALTTRLAQLQRGSDPSLLNQSDAPPPGLEHLPGQVQALGAMRASGKYDPTYYNMLRDNIAKQARADSPTERDFIDNEFMHITWRDPANKVIQSLTQDINAYETNAKEQRSKVDNTIWKGVSEGVIPYAAWQAYQQNPSKMEGRLVTQIAQHNAYKSNLETQDLEMRNLEAKKRLTAQDAQAKVGATTDQSVALALNGMTLHVDGIHDPVSASDLHNGIASGTIQKPDENTSIAISQQYSALADNWEAQKRKEFNTIPPPSPGNPNPKPMSYYLGGPGEVDKEIARGREQIERQGKFYAAGDTSIAAGQKQFYDAALNAQATRVLQQNPAVNLLALGPKMFGKDSAAYNDWFTKITTDPKLTEQLGPSVVSSIAGMMAQPNVSGGSPYFTMSEAFKRAQSQDVKDPNFYDGVTRYSTGLLNNKSVPPEAKASLANGIYGSKDLTDLVNNSQMDAQGRITPGKSTLVSDLVNDKIAKEIKHTGNREAINNFVQTGQQWVGSIFHSEIATINAHDSDPNLKFRYDTENNRWSVDYVGKTPGFRPDQILRSGLQDFARPFSTQLGRLGINVPPEEYEALKAYPVIKGSIDKLNLAIQSLGSISREFTGEDINTMAVRLMLQSGLDPNIDADTNGNKLIQSIKAGSTQPKATPQ